MKTLYAADSIYLSQIRQSCTRGINLNEFIIFSNIHAIFIWIIIYQSIEINHKNILFKPKDIQGHNSSIKMSKSLKPLEVALLPVIPTSQQLIESLKNLQKVVSINTTSPQFQSAIQEFGEERLVMYKLSPNINEPKQEVQLVCFMPEQKMPGKEYYIDQIRGQLFRIDVQDNLVLERVQSSEAKLNQNHHVLIKALYRSLKSYLSQHHAAPYSIACHFGIQSQTLSKITLAFTSKLTNFPNYYTGQITSHWTFLNDSYSATINIRNHFYENGNVMLHKHKKINQNTEKQEQRWNFTDLKESDLSKILRIIEYQEAILIKQIKDDFQKKLSLALKKLRRTAPLTQGRMIWNVNAVQLSEGLHERSQAFH